MYGLLQIRLHGIEQIRRRIHINEHAIRHDPVQPFQFLLANLVGADYHETVELGTGRNHVIEVVEHRHFHALLLSIALERRTQISEIGVTQRFFGLLIIKQRDLMRNDDAFGLHAVAEIFTRLNDLTTRLLTHGKSGIPIQKSRHRSLRKPGTLRNFFNRRHVSLSNLVNRLPHERITYY